MEEKRTRKLRISGKGCRGEGGLAGPEVDLPPKKGNENRKCAEFFCKNYVNNHYTNLRLLYV